MATSNDTELKEYIVNYVESDELADELAESGAFEEGQFVYTPDDEEVDVKTLNEIDICLETYGGTAYYPIAKFNKSIDEGSNSSYVTITGKIGGWEYYTGASINALFYGRGSRGGRYNYTGYITNAFTRNDFVMYEENSTSVILYLKTNGYSNVRLNVKITSSSGGVNIIYDGSSVSTPTGTLIYTMSNQGSDMLGVPSNSNYVDIAWSGDTYTYYTAPANGYVMMKAVGQNNDNYLRIRTFTNSSMTTLKFEVSTNTYGTYWDGGCMCPVKKGDYVEFLPHNVFELLMRFVPAEGV